MPRIFDIFAITELPVWTGSSAYNLTVDLTTIQFIANVHIIRIYDILVVMQEDTPLVGSCSCGRNHYVIYAPPDPLRSLQLLLEAQAGHGNSLLQSQL